MGSSWGRRRVQVNQRKEGDEPRMKYYVVEERGRIAFGVVLAQLSLSRSGILTADALLVFNIVASSPRSAADVVAKNPDGVVPLSVKGSREMQPRLPTGFD